MAGLEPSLPPPPEDIASKGDDCRLWVGNLDTRITEFALLKLLQKYGDLKKFDFLYHKSGPDQGKPRGYCFVSYHSVSEASWAIRGLNGKMALSKKLIVRWAHADKTQEFTSVRPGEVTPQAPCTTQCKSNINKESKIRMIEAKLKMMESSNVDFTLSDENASTGRSGNSSTQEPIANGRLHKSKSSSSKPYSQIPHSEISERYFSTTKR